MSSPAFSKVAACLILKDLEPLVNLHPCIRITCPPSFPRPKAFLGTTLTEPALPKPTKPSFLCCTGEHFKGARYSVRRGVVAQSSGEKHGYTESLPYVDPVRIHEGRVCLSGKCGESKLVRSPLCVCAKMCVYM